MYVYIYTYGACVCVERCNRGKLHFCAIEIARVCAAPPSTEEREKANQKGTYRLCTVVILIKLAFLFAAAMHFSH